ncbi:MAG: RDD family protein [Halioglobus sp.]|nr:RDD family protein [Halioglobus sp.]
MQDTTSLPPPSLPRRLTAILYDALLVIALVAVTNALALGVQVKVFGSETHELHPQLAQALVITSVYGFFILFWLKQGQTLGMQAWRIKLVGSDGQAPAFGQALLRCLGATLSAACLGLGYLWCLVDPQKRTWHDRLSRTQLILLPRRERRRRDNAAKS